MSSKSSRWWDSNVLGGEIKKAGIKGAELRRKRLLAQASSTNLKDIASQNFVFKAGLDKNGKIVVGIHCKQYWEQNEAGFWHKLMLHVLQELEGFVSQGSIVIVYLHDHRVKLPGFQWLRRLSSTVDHSFVGKVDHVYVLHPSLALKMMLQFAETNMGASLAGKVTKLATLQELSTHLTGETMSLLADLVPPEMKLDGSESQERKALKTGVLHKVSSQGLIPSAMKRLAFNQRRVVLSEDCIWYHSEKNELRGVIPLEGCTLIPEYKKMKHAFTLTLANEDRTHFSAESDEEMNDWIQAITKQMSHEKVFGVSLEDHMSSSDMSFGVPFVVSRCIGRLKEGNGLVKEGIFRISGNQARILELSKQFDTYWDADLDEADMHTVAGLLKRYLRDLPDPVIPFSHYKKMLDAVDGIDSVEDLTKAHMDRISQLVAEIPNFHRRLLHEILQLGKDVAALHEENRMPTSNVATVLAPNILRPEAEEADAVAALKDTPLVNRVFLAMLENMDRLEDALRPNRESIAGDGGEEEFYKRFAEKMTTLNRTSKIQTSLAAFEEIERSLGIAAAAGVAEATDIDICKKAVEENPDSADAWERLASAYHHKFQFEDSLQAYNEAMARNPNNAHCYIKAGMIHEIRGDVDTAKNLYRRCKSMSGGTIAAHMLQDLSRRADDNVDGRLRHSGSLDSGIHRDASTSRESSSNFRSDPGASIQSIPESEPTETVASDDDDDDDEPADGDGTLLEHTC